MRELKMDKINVTISLYFEVKDAEMLKVPKENVCIISRTEYAENMEG